MHNKIETDSLLLRKPVFQDWVSMYHNLWSREESAKYMLWSVTSSEADAQERMHKSIAFQEKTRDTFFVYLKQTGEGIGFAGMKKIAPGVFEDTGIALGPDYTGKGYGKEILNALLKRAEEYGARTFVYSCRRRNLASAALARSCGFFFDHEEQREDPRDGSTYVLDFYQCGLKQTGADGCIM